ncbi:hypothetical protein DENSPDRAFT_227209 [Dentipellis sp. KUC8613]|nr:hypothetical protein DENSPDRAFT_227209 [Dentipellis sp. KUC8613]
MVHTRIRKLMSAPQRPMTRSGAQREAHRSAAGVTTCFSLRYIGHTCSRASSRSRRRPTAQECIAPPDASQALASEHLRRHSRMYVFLAGRDDADDDADAVIARPAQGVLPEQNVNAGRANAQLYPAPSFPTPAATRVDVRSVLPSPSRHARACVRPAQRARAPVVSTHSCTR